MKRAGHIRRERMTRRARTMKIKITNTARGVFPPSSPVPRPSPSIASSRRRDARDVITGKSRAAGNQMSFRRTHARVPICRPRKKGCRRAHSRSLNRSLWASVKSDRRGRAEMDYPRRADLSIKPGALVIQACTSRARPRAPSRMQSRYSPAAAARGYGGEI